MKTTNTGDISATAPPSTPLADDPAAFHAAIDTEMSGGKPPVAASDAPPQTPAKEQQGEPPEYEVDDYTAPDADTEQQADGTEATQIPTEGDQAQQPPEVKPSKPNRRTARGRIHELVSQKNAERVRAEEAEKKAAAAAAEAERLRAELEQAQASDADGSGEDGDLPAEVLGVKRPVEEAFTDEDGAWDEAGWRAAWAKYNRALARYDMLAIDESKRVEREKAVFDAWTQREATYARQTPAYAQAADALRTVLWTQDGQARNPTLVEHIKTASNGPEIAHALGADPDLADRIIGIRDPVALKQALVKVQAPTAKQPAQGRQTSATQAPEMPPVQLTGAQAGVQVRDPAHQTIDEYMASAGTEQKPRGWAGR